MCLHFSLFASTKEVRFNGNKKISQLTGNIPTTFTKGYVNVKIKTFIDYSYNNINIRYEFS